MSQSFEKRVTDWAAARKIFSGSTASKQLDKLSEEHDELIEAISDGDIDKTMDAIGDMAVVLVILSEMHGVSFAECCEAAWEQIKDRRGEMRDGIFVKEEDL